MLELRDAGLPGRLQGASAGFAAGEVTAICGPNGAGKSTLLALAAGLLAPASGAVLLDGAPLAGMAPRERARRIGYLPQVGEAAWDLSVETLVRLGRLPHASGRTQDDRAVSQALNLLALGGLADRPLSSLSGGERARAMLARVLAGEPQWILADEPLASLDLAHQASLLARFRTVAASGTAVVLVLHDLAAAMNFADRVLVLDQGRIAADGPPAEVLAPPLLRQVWGVDAAWLGEPGSKALSVTLPA